MPLETHAPPVTRPSTFFRFSHTFAPKKSAGQSSRGKSGSTAIASSHDLRSRRVHSRTAFSSARAGGTLNNARHRSYAPVDLFEIPSASENRFIRLAAMRASVQENHRLEVGDLGTESDLVRLDRIGRNPHAVLQKSEVFLTQVPPQSPAQRRLLLRNVIKHKSPASVPRAVPLFIGLPSSNRRASTRRCQSYLDLAGGTGAAFQHLKPLGFAEAPAQSPAPGPTLKCVRRDTPGGARKRLRRPPQKIQKLPGTWSHGQIEGMLERVIPFCIQRYKN